jgi:hypothetical protein
VCILDAVITSRYCSREDICKPIIVDSEVLTGLGPVVFPFTPEGFPRTNFCVLLVVIAEFIFLHCFWMS